MHHISECLPGFVQPKTYAQWPVWRDSTTKDVRFAPLSRKEAARWWHKARRLDRETHTPGKHGGVIGHTALKVYYVLVFDFLDYVTGRLDPAIKAIAQKAGVCERSVSTAIKRLHDLGLLCWQRRCCEDRDKDGRFRLRQRSNAYAILPPSNWKGYQEPPAPEPGTWGDHPPLPDTIAQAVNEMNHGQLKTMLDVLTDDIHNSVAVALARLGRAVFEREKSADFIGMQSLPRTLTQS